MEDKKTISDKLTLGFRLNYSLKFKTENGIIVANEAENFIVRLGTMSVFPDMPISELKIRSIYGKGTDVELLDAVKIMNMFKLAKHGSYEDSVYDVSGTYIDFTRDFDYKKDTKVYSGVIKSDEYFKQVTYITSKKIKIFVNGTERKPKDEQLFIERIFPQIEFELNLR